MVNQKGLTLVELLVVVAVVGVLAGLVVVSINPRAQTNAATEARARSNVSEVAKAMVACITINNGSETLCNTWAELRGGGFVGLVGQPAGVVVGTGCVSEEEAGSKYCKYTTGWEDVRCDEAIGC